MATLSEQQHEIEAARQEVREAFNAAGPSWAVQPPSGEGEDAWSPKQVAEHLIGAEAFFVNNIAPLVGIQAPGRPEIDCSSPEAAATTYQRVAAQSDAVITTIKDEDLAKTVQLRMGEMSVSQILGIISSHARDHAQQIRAVTVP